MGYLGASICPHRVVNGPMKTSAGRHLRDTASTHNENTPEIGARRRGRTVLAGCSQSLIAFRTSPSRLAAAVRMSGSRTRTSRSPDVTPTWGDFMTPGRRFYARFATGKGRIMGLGLALLQWNYSSTVHLSRS